MEVYWTKSGAGRLLVKYPGQRARAQAKLRDGQVVAYNTATTEERRAMGKFLEGQGYRDIDGTLTTWRRR